VINPVGFFRFHYFIFLQIPDTLVAEEIDKVTVFHSDHTYFMNNNSLLKPEAVTWFDHNFNPQVPKKNFRTRSSSRTKWHNGIKDRLSIFLVLVVFATLRAHTQSNGNIISWTGKAQELMNRSIRDAVCNRWPHLRI